MDSDSYLLLAGLENLIFLRDCLSYINLYE